jgi:hypothetical protein
MTLVKHVLEAARKRLAVLSREASLVDAARILANRDTIGPDAMPISEA